jgi:hypothetical protein
MTSKLFFFNPQSAFETRRRVVASLLTFSLTLRMGRNLKRIEKEVFLAEHGQDDKRDAE